MLFEEIKAYQTSAYVETLRLLEFLKSPIDITLASRATWPVIIYGMEFVDSTNRAKLALDKALKVFRSSPQILVIEKKPSEIRVMLAEVHVDDSDLAIIFSFSERNYVDEKANREKFALLLGKTNETVLDYKSQADTLQLLLSQLQRANSKNDNQRIAKQIAATIKIIKVPEI